VENVGLGCPFDAADLIEVIGLGLVRLVGFVEQATDLFRKNHLGKHRRDSRRQENQQRQENGGKEIQIRKLLSNGRLQGKLENIKMMTNRNLVISIRSVTIFGWMLGKNVTMRGLTLPH
jgi:hypothetical protein